MADTTFLLQQIRTILQEENAPVIKRLGNVDERLKNVEIVGLQTKSAVEAIAEGQKDIRKSVVKELKNHARRITELEDHAHSHKN